MENAFLKCLGTLLINKTGKYQPIIFMLADVKDQHMKVDTFEKNMFFSAE